MRNCQAGLLKPAQVKKQDPDNPACRKYFMHGLGHPLGLDVHDVGDLNVPFQPGTVLTVEPGIIAGRRLWRAPRRRHRHRGRPINLMAKIPIEADEIESIMNR